MGEIKDRENSSDSSDVRGNHRRRSHRNIRRNNQIYVKIESYYENIFRSVRPTAEMKNCLECFKNLLNIFNEFKIYVESNPNLTLDECSAREKLEQLNTASFPIINGGFLKEKICDPSEEESFTIESFKDDSNITNEILLMNEIRENNVGNFFDSLKNIFMELLGDKLYEFDLVCNKINFFGTLDTSVHSWEAFTYDYEVGEENCPENQRYRNIPTDLIYDFSDIMSLEYIDHEGYELSFN